MAVNHSKAEAAVVIVRLHGDCILCKRSRLLGPPVNHDDAYIVRRMAQSSRVKLTLKDNGFVAYRSAVFVCGHRD